MITANISQCKRAITIIKKSAVTILGDMPVQTDKKKSRQTNQT